MMSYIGVKPFGTLVSLTSISCCREHEGASVISDLLFNRLCNSLGEAGAKKNNKENVKYYCTDFLLYARTTCMYLCNEE